MWQRNIRCWFQPYQSWTRLSAFFVGMAIVGFRSPPDRWVVDVSQLTPLASKAALLSVNIMKVRGAMTSPSAMTRTIAGAEPKGQDPEHDRLRALGGNGC